MDDQIHADNVALLKLLADIRCAAGDPEGRLMQDELVKHIADMRRDHDRYRAAFLSEQDKHKETFEGCQAEKVHMFCDMELLKHALRELADASMQRILRPDDSEATLRLFKANQRAQELLS